MLMMMQANMLTGVHKLACSSSVPLVPHCSSRWNKVFRLQVVDLYSLSYIIIIIVPLFQRERERAELFFQTLQCLK